MQRRRCDSLKTLEKVHPLLHDTAFSSQKVTFCMECRLLCHEKNLLYSELEGMMQIYQAILMLIFAVKCAGNTDGECGSEDSVLF